MSEAGQRPGGWFDSLLVLAQSRLELFAVEVHEEKLRALRLLVWLGLALTLGAAGLLVGIGALALCLWDLAGYAGLVGLALAALAGAAGVWWSIRRQIRAGPLPFPETIAEFKKDRECLRRKD